MLTSQLHRLEDQGFLLTQYPGHIWALVGPDLRFEPGSDLDRTCHLIWGSSLPTHHLESTVKSTSTTPRHTSTTTWQTTTAKHGTISSTTLRRRRRPPPSGVTTTTRNCQTQYKFKFATDHHLTLSLNNYHHHVSHKGKRGDEDGGRPSCLFPPKKVSCKYFLSFFILILITGTFPTRFRKMSDDDEGSPPLSPFIPLPTQQGGFPRCGFLSFWPNRTCKCSFWVFLWPNHVRIDQIERTIVRGLQVRSNPRHA